MGAGAKHKFVFVDRLLATLVNLRHGTAHDVLACWFGVNRSTITRAIGEVRPLLAQRGHRRAPGTAYQVNDPPVNFLVVLDLTDKPDGLAAVPACVHIRTVPGSASDPGPRTVIMLRTQGNKRDPHEL
ncbi:helix-turn-helix domain-containing protein [Streptomyces indiaensis]|uniref:helix-turn-helix domain-containing protein n=1 Tax=Streptomyces indiaensis TaxID=284033 RepID=UPI001F4367E4|nr:transposase family protein [Streptomyces indiaensis]MCF1646472.1 transposase family protein [Streptomyces indiaensis]